MNPTDLLARAVSSLWSWWANRPTYTKVVLVVAVTVFLTELAFRRFAPRSAAYARWTRVFEAVGTFWTAVILSVVYFASVSLVSLFLKLSGKDPLDRSLASEPTFWRPHEPNPLGPRGSARHQF